MKRVAVMVAVFAIALVVVPFALAGGNGTSRAAYGGESAVQAALVDGSTATASQSQSLPFTGLDLGVAVLAGTILVAVGFGMRRLARK